MAKRKIGSKAVGRQKAMSGISVLGPIHLSSDASFIQGGSSPDWTGGDATVPQPYKNHAYVYACVRAISQNIGQVPIKVQVGDEEDPSIATQEDPGTPGQLAKLFTSPNKYMNMYQLWECTVAHMNLDGAAFWILDRKNVTEIPKKIWVVGSACMYPVLGPEQDILGWVYSDGSGNREALTLAEVLMFKFYNPYDHIFGLAPIEAARRGITLDFLANSYGKAFFENSADPSGVILSERKLTEKQMREIRTFWEERHRGAGNAKRVGVLYGGMKYQPIGVTQKDMEFIAQRGWTRDEILAVFKVPKSELSLYEDVNHATSLSQNKGFWEKTLIPIIRNMEAVLASEFVPGLRTTIGDEFRLVFDTKTVPALQEQLTDKISNAEKLAKMGYPINAINKLLSLGLPNVTWGDTWYVNQAVVPIEFVLDGRTTINPKPSGQTVPAPNGDSDVVNDPDEPETVEEAVSTAIVKRNRLSSIKALVAAKNADVVSKKAIVDGSIGVIKTIIKTSLWRMRRHQLSLSVKDGSVFNMQVWEKKFCAKVYPEVSKVLLSVGVQIAEEQFRSSTIATVHELVRMCSSDLGKLRTLFNRMSEDRTIVSLAKQEICNALRISNNLKGELSYASQTN